VEYKLAGKGRAAATLGLTDLLQLFDKKESLWQIDSVLLARTNLVMASFLMPIGFFVSSLTRLFGVGAVKLAITSTNPQTVAKYIEDGLSTQRENSSQKRSSQKEYVTIFTTSKYLLKNLDKINQIRTALLDKYRTDNYGANEQAIIKRLRIEAIMYLIGAN